MALNIKNQDVENILNEVVQITGESKTVAVLRALEERRQRLSFQLNSHQNETHLLSFLQDEIWPQVPLELRGSTLTKEEEEAILGYGEMGI